mgnify:CR=1 FL=1
MVFSGPIQKLMPIICILKQVYCIAGKTDLNSFGVNICSRTVTLGSESFGLQDFNIYPNPNNGNFTLQFSKAATSAIEVTVFDMRGRKIFENSYNSEGAFNENIQLNNAQTGIYLVSVSDGVNKIVKRIAVE